MAIKLNFTKTDKDLTGCSKWWGFPDMPDSLEFPEIPVDEEYSDPMTFICQIRCEELAPFDPEGLLPHSGMLWFFGALDYFLGNLDAEVRPGMGEWEAPYFKVLYSEECNGRPAQGAAPGAAAGPGTAAGPELFTHRTVYDDGTPACRPAEALTFSACADREDCIRLAGKPYFDEINELYPDYVSLLQIDEDDDWGLRFFDCGMLCFLLQPEDLRKCRFQYTKCYLHSF